MMKMISAMGVRESKDVYVGADDWMNGDIDMYDMVYNDLKSHAEDIVMMRGWILALMTRLRLCSKR